MNFDNIIRIKNVKKMYRLYTDKGYTLKEKILFFESKNYYIKHQVLKGITFDIKKGEVVGLIGKNGCGKSTLLKLISKIIYPDSGEIKVRGKISSLLELGTGFHPDMTGRENIYIYSSILGLTRKEVEVILEDIIEFSELGEFIDSPIRTYSSGMYARLAFSVAINVRSEILLIDEILSVGDINFQKKCFEKIKTLKKEGTTIVIVSHDLNSLQNICDKVVWLSEGKIKKIGDTKEIIEDYISEARNEE